MGEPRPVAPELGFLGQGLLQAGEIRGQGGWGRHGERIDPPGSLLGRRHQAVTPEVGQVPRYFGLGQAQHRLEMTDAQGLLRQEVQQAEARGVAQTVVKAEELQRG